MAVAEARVTLVEEVEAALTAAEAVVDRVAAALLTDAKICGKKARSNWGGLFFV
jgi:hypothetical protein